MTHSLADEAVVLEESRRCAAARLHDAEEEGRADIAGKTFHYREELFTHLFYARAERMPAPVGKIDCPANRVSRTDFGMLKCVAITLWGEYARANDLDPRMITAEQYELVAKAQAQKAVGQGPSVRDVGRLMERHATTHPELDIRPGDGRVLHMPRRD